MGFTHHKRHVPAAVRQDNEEKGDSGCCCAGLSKACGIEDFGGCPSVTAGA